MQTRKFILLETALYFEGVDNEKAKKILKTVLEKDDDNSNALFSLGRILLYEFDKEVLSTYTRQLD